MENGGHFVSAQCVNHDDMEMDDEMDDEMETFPHYWPFVRGIHGHH